MPRLFVTGQKRSNLVKSYALLRNFCVTQKPPNPVEKPAFRRGFSSVKAAVNFGWFRREQKRNGTTATPGKLNMIEPVKQATASPRFFFQSK